ncbi:MAG TPA: hypothetical protein VIW69_02065 [Candidatus Elarobacter sp.]
MIKRAAAVLVLWLAWPAVAAACPVDGPRDQTRTPTELQTHRNRYLLAGAALDGRVFNELSPGIRVGAFSHVGIDAVSPGGSDTNGSLRLSGDVRAGNGVWLAQLEIDHREYVHLANALRAPPGYCPGDHDPGCVSLIGAAAFAAATGSGQGYVATFPAVEQDTEIHLAPRLRCSHVFAGLGYLRRSVSYLQYPVQQGLGFGVERDVTLERRFSTYAGLWYYPAAGGTYTVPPGPATAPLAGRRFTVAYGVLRYHAGALYRVRFTRLFVSAGIEGNHGSARADAPAAFQSHRFVGGLGVAF